MSRSPGALELLRGYRRQRRRGTERPVDATTLVGAALILGGFPVQLFVGLIVDAPDQVSTAGSWAAVGMALCCFGAGAALLQAIGPIVVGRATAATLLAAPLPRRTVLGRRHLLLLALAGVVGAVVAAAGAAVGGTHQLSGYLAAVSTGAGAGLLVASVGVLLQPAAAVRPGSAGRLLGPGLLGIGLAIVAAAAVARATSFRLPWPSPGWTTTVTPIVVGVLAMLASLIGRRALDRLPSPALTAGATVVTAARASGSFVDLALLGGVLSQRRALRRARVPFRALPSQRVPALLVADLRRLRRNRSGVLLITGLIAVPYSATLLLAPNKVGMLATLAAAGVATVSAAGLRAVRRSAAMRRMLGGRDRDLTVLHLVLPTVVVAGWTAAIAPALGAYPVAWLLTAVGGLLFCLIQSRRPEPDFTAPATDFGYGMMSPQVIVALLPGYLVLGLFCLAQFAIA